MFVVVCLLAGVAVGARDAVQWAPPAWEADGARFRVDPDTAREAGVAVLPAPGPLRFAPGTAAADREAVLAAIASARPEARGLIARVSGLTTVSIGATGPDSAGVARSKAEGWDVELDLASIVPRFGPRGTARLVLHELAHVVDHALVTSELEERLDLATPAGLVCTADGIAGACAAREERFAESFAKWAVGDIGLNIEFGYQVPPPNLATWGRPLDVLLD